MRAGAWPCVLWPCHNAITLSRKASLCGLNHGRACVRFGGYAQRSRMDAALQSLFLFTASASLASKADGQCWIGSVQIVQMCSDREVPEQCPDLDHPHANHLRWCKPSIGIAGMAAYLWLHIHGGISRGMAVFCVLHRTRNRTLQSASCPLVRKEGKQVFKPCDKRHKACGRRGRVRRPDTTKRRRFGARQAVTR